ncbi:hypothetical protein CKAH01_14413 [Colletotrichum kahawae]|uniref:Uncharacterized protein n=1 Tax=Colletotrichum kahawae TaxID=34407 RepID=A0AAE0DA77_COLKA|nr:hypothetical protein CKAH01_14413 [Colletotrichum kahawae]
MPTATATSQYAITNVGPLTTVFTTPTACATASPDLYLAISGAWGRGTDRVAAFYKQKCDQAALGECFPSGNELDDAYSAASTEANTDRATIAYFSPASQCPDSYTTAGSAHRGSDGNVTSSGIFVPPVVTSGLRDGGLIGYNPPLNVLMEVLDEDETAVVCCPEKYTVGINGGCFSQVPESVYGERIACGRYIPNGVYTEVTAAITYNNTVITGRVLSYTASGPYTYSTRVQTYTASAITESMYPVAYKPAVTLVNKGEAGETGGASGSGSGTAAPSGTGASAARGMRMTTAGGGVGILATVWTFAALAGVALAMPF